MQNELLDIIIIGCLVLLFASTYRKRATTMVRAWTLGWLLILVHFAAQMLHPRQLLAQRFADLVGLSALLGCAAVFLLPASREEDRRSQARLIAYAGVACFVHSILVIWDLRAPAPYYVALAIGQTAAIRYALRLRRSSSVITVASLVTIAAACSVWMIWCLVHHRTDVCTSAILFEFYLFVAVAYMAQFQRISGGTLTVSCGLLAWASVFPVAQFCVHLGVIDRISPEFWNVPKYFVAFGMILVLFEEEIRSASGASKHYRLLFEGNPRPMWICRQETLEIESVNEAAVAQYGYTREEFHKLRVTDLCPERTLYGEELPPSQSGPALHRRKDGTAFLAQATTRRIHSNGQRLALVLVEDITERQDLHDKLVHQASHDLLTGLPNRALLEQTLRKTLAHAQRYGRQSALLCLDVDRFKQINDTYGHAVGDACLQEVAQRLKSRMRAVDIAARVGGEEFAVMLHEISNANDAELVAADLLHRLHEPFRTGGFTIEMTASIGIAVYPQDAPDAARLWRNADCAMYRAKRAGGNQYLCMSPEIDAQTTEANEMELQLRRALKGEGGLELYLQPLYRTTGELASLEALVRFNHPHFGLIAPDKFVPIAEETGLIVPLGLWVLDEVLRLITQWMREGLPLVPVAMNVSPRQLTRPDFAQTVIRALERHQVPANMLGLEITETAMMRNMTEATRQISRLAALGVAFSIDDFGTGYSSLAHIDKLPVQTLKIDRTFTDRLCRPSGTYSIVDAIISMAHSLGMEVVAEGVEEPEQLKRLHDLHCDTVQGYLFSRPLPATEVPELLTRGVDLHAMMPQRLPSWVA